MREERRREGEVEQKLTWVLSKEYEEATFEGLKSVWGGKKEGFWGCFVRYMVERSIAVEAGCYGLGASGFSLGRRY